MENKVKVALLAMVLSAAACHRGSSTMQRNQKNYDVVSEGQASGVTSTINAPGEATPPMTNTSADTTSNFTLSPNVDTTGTAAPGTIAGTMPVTTPGMPAPPRITTAPPPPMTSGSSGAGSQSRIVITNTEPRRHEQQPAPPPQNTQPQPPPPSTDTTSTTTSSAPPPPPPQTDTTTTTEPKKSDENKKKDDQDQEQPQQPPPPPPPTQTDTRGW